MDTPLWDPPSPASLTAADREHLLPRYELFDEVGRGGMGIVYRARHRLLGRQVAVKVNLPKCQTERFHREAQLLARLRSPRIVTVHDLELLPGGRTLLVMDWVEGTDLGKVIKGAGGPLPELRVLPWMREVAEGMGTASEQGIVHRDLKPSNILIDSRDAALVADFGLARSLDVERLTLEGGLMGTPDYMAPEQAEDPCGVDTRADIYSFGATFYHALTGHPPFQGSTHFSILFKHKTEPLVAPRTRNSRLSVAVGECLERCLAKSPAERFPSFADVLACLRPGGVGGSPWEVADDAHLARYLARYVVRRPVYLQGTLNPDKPDRYQFSQERAILIGTGSLIDQRVDAVVSSDDDRLSMGGGVSAALSRAAGPGLREEAQRFVPVRPGRAIVTTGGDLPARFVFHAVSIRYPDFVGGPAVTPSRDLINEIMEACFYHADTLGVRTIAFPLLGTGVAGFSRETCLDTMFRFLARKFARGVTAVREARVIIYTGYSD